jgi:hypothetical protein
MHDRRQAQEHPIVKLPTRLALATAAIALSAPAFAVTVVNGSFENPSIVGSHFDTYTTASTLPGWTVEYGSVDLVKFNPTTVQGWSAQDGSQSVDLNGNTRGAISQVLTGFTANSPYQLSYWYSATTVGGAKVSLTYLDGTSGTNGFTSTIDATANTGWTQQILNFTPTTTNVKLTFDSLVYSGPLGMAIDNVNVALVPEPHEWAMMLAGLGLVGWAARRARPQGMPAAAA